jgi:membrane protein YqaA with SNARE-associated domain
MITQKFHERMQKLVQFLQRFTDRSWYPPLIGFLAALDNLVLIIPNDGILISSSILTPRRWFGLALCVAIGSTVGAVVLASLVELHGLPWIQETYPGMVGSKAWAWSAQFFDKYGLFLVFGVAVTPFLQQPAVILASLADTPMFELAAVIFIGRFIKFLIMAHIGSHAPQKLNKMWGLKGELREVGVKLK